MTFKKALEEIKKNNKVKHESWNLMLVEGFSENYIKLRDKDGWLHYFNLQEFIRAFDCLNNKWIFV